MVFLVDGIIMSVAIESMHRYRWRHARELAQSKEANAALRVSEAKFRSIFENANTGIAATDRYGRVTSFNEAFRAMLGYDAETLGRMNLADLTHPDDLAHELVFFDEILQRKREHYHIQKRYVASDGHIIWIDISVAAIRDENGEISNFIGVVTDLTARVKAEEELRLAASVFHNSSEGVVITDADAVILSVNPAFEEITGYTADEAIGQKPSLLRSDRHGPDFYRSMWSALQSDGAWKGEIWNRRKNGEAYLEWLTINRIVDNAGATVRYVSVFHDITELRRKDEHIRHQAFHDALTGLPNRMLFQERLQHALSRSRREGSSLSVTFIDLDGFKDVNDTLGHDVGDALLQEVADRIRARLRRGVDTVARLGGDEFVVLMEDLREADLCASLADEIIADISRPFEFGSHEIQVGASMGMAFYPEDGDTVQKLMKCADTAMYAAKTAGKGTYRFFQPGMFDKVSARITFEAELRNAIKLRQFVLHYQPQLDLRSGRVVGLEALVRWQHPERGLVSPVDFVPVAEETGLILPIGDWVLEEACRQLAAWRARGLDDIKISVNLSANQFADTGLPLRIEKILERTDVPATSLTLEVTESTAMKEPADAAAMMRVLTAQKLSLSIDDFGTGYSSLAYLKMFPISTLKIDRAFVKDIETDPDDAGICDVTVLLAHKLGLDVVAEGVETAGQLKFLLSIGCEKIQGYLISKPLPADQVEDFIRNKPALDGLGTVEL